METLKEHKLQEICFEITNVCALNCVHCSNFDPKIQTTLYYTLQLIEETIDSIAALGVDIIEFSGGEPLMHPNITEAIEYARNKRIRTVLYTSGIVSNSDYSYISLSKARKLADCGLDALVFNIQGSKPAIHESITRVKGSFRKTIQSLKNARTQGLQIGIHFVPMKPNYKDLRNVVNLAQDLKAEEVGILRFVPQGLGYIYRTELALTRMETLELMYDIKRIAQSLTEELTLRVGRPQNFCPLVDPSAKFNICDAGISKCLIKPNGEVVPCPAFKRNPDYVAGNIFEESLEQIWHSSPILRRFRTFDYRNIKGCSSCPRVSECQGHCIAQRVIATHHMLKGSDPCCPKPLTVATKSF